MSKGKSVKLFLADGLSGGLLTAEIMNWTGHCLSVPRSELAEFLKRPEATRTGMYVLLGDSPESSFSTTAYIGEGDDVGKRLRRHASSENKGGKDFWDKAVVVTSKDSNLTKAHARYLESRLLSIAFEANRCDLTNSTNPDPILLPEADVSDMEYFIEQIKIIMPLLGVNILRSVKQADSSSGLDSPTFVFEVVKHGVSGKAQEVDGEFVLLEGSIVRSAWEGSGHSYQKRHEDLTAAGDLVPNESGTAQVVRNIAFNSPSAAVAVVAGRSANGRESWVLESDPSTTYALWQEQQLEQIIDLEHTVA